ncbi:hypothetical protein CAI20_00855 [Wolbachia endosymbiont of Chrysomya megacephala]|nr:hypothetical protein CAI20_00855 [Wolbachia endosymbiont of Chrysomya megacephala]
MSQCLFGVIQVNSFLVIPVPRHWDPENFTLNECIRLSLYRCQCQLLG